MSQVATGVQLGEAEAVRASVSKYYGETLQATSDLKTSACCTAKAPPADVLAVLRQLPQEIIQKYYGCGSPFPAGLKGSGLRVLDLGCGTGRDCYVCAALVGEKGFVTGLDMTAAQLEVAQRHCDAWQQQLGYAAPNMRFLQGKIEELAAAGIAPGNIDLIISNCVINLSPDKAAVLKEAYQALADGGEVFFSDVYCDRRLPAAVRSHEVLLGECLGGALTVNDFLRLAHQVGFADPRVLEVEPIAVHDPELKALLGDAAFYSITFRLFKLPGQLEELPEEDYGQAATYLGSLPGCEAEYVLDNAHSFSTGTAVRVSGNTAAMLASSWLKPHFTVAGDSSQHLGQFASAGVTLSAASIAALAAASGSNGGSCCPPKAAANGSSAGGGCCAPKAAAAAPAAQPAVATSSCCAPSKSKAEAAAPATAAKSGCCAPAAQPAAAAAGGFCAPKQPAAAAASSCCAPKQPAAANGSGCCAPKQTAASSGSCCPPKK